MIVEMKNISKIFGSAYALKDVDFIVGSTVGSGEIHALLGENGAGKSTLMNILGGVLPQTTGDILIDGNKVEITSVKKAKEYGIRFVHQELSMFNHLKVYENMFIGEEITKSGLLDQNQMIRLAEETLSKLRIQIDPRTVVGGLDMSSKQMIEIAKAVRTKSKLIILDEPTSSLTNKEIEALFNIMRNLKEQGVNLIFISHKLPEVMEICEKYTVLRDGAVVGSGSIKEVNEAIITDMLVGRKIYRGKVEKPKVPHNPYLQVRDFTLEPHFRNISFDLHRGEVLVLTGLRGDGRAQLAEALFGIRKITSGQLIKDGKPVNLKSIKNIIRSGIGMIQRDRKERSIIPDMSIIDNLSIANYIAKHNKLFIDSNEEEERFKKNQAITNIKAANPKDTITSLSGGNQQKVIFSRWLEIDSDIYIMDNPTQGVDVGAKQEIYNIINELAKKGKSIIVFSEEYPEIYQIADRVLVMYEGGIEAELNRDELSENKVMYYATGSSKGKAASK